MQSTKLRQWVRLVSLALLLWGALLGQGCQFTPSPEPEPTPTSTPVPLCNLHIDDFGDTNHDNDLRKPTYWELDPLGCGSSPGREYNGSELKLEYDLTLSSPCKARYTTTLSLDAS